MLGINLGAFAYRGAREMLRALEAVARAGALETAEAARMRVAIDGKRIKKGGDGILYLWLRKFNSGEMMRNHYNAEVGQRLAPPEARIWNCVTSLGIVLV